MIAKKTIKVKLYPDIGSTKEIEILVDTSRDINEQINNYIDKHLKFITEYEILNIKNTLQTFIDDKEKMKDFKNLSKNEFLKSYSYLDEIEYDNTKKLYDSLLGKIKNYDETKIKQEELQTKLNKIENQILNIIPSNISKENFNNLINEIRYDYHAKDNIENREMSRYEIGIYETREDYEQGKPFQHDVVSDLNEAENTLNSLMKSNNYYSGFVLDQRTGIEEYAYYSDEQMEDKEEDEL